MTRTEMAMRDKKIKQMYKTGNFSIRTLAKKVRLSKTRVHEIVIE